MYLGNMCYPWVPAVTVTAMKLTFAFITLLETVYYRGKCPLTSSSALNFSVLIWSNISSTRRLITASPSLDLRETSRTHWQGYNHSSFYTLNPVSVYVFSGTQKETFNRKHHDFSDSLTLITSLSVFLELQNFSVPLKHMMTQWTFLMQVSLLSGKYPDSPRSSAQASLQSSSSCTNTSLCEEWAGAMHSGTFIKRFQRHFHHHNI